MKVLHLNIKTFFANMDMLEAFEQDCRPCQIWQLSEIMASGQNSERAEGRL